MRANKPRMSLLLVTLLTSASPTTAELLAAAKPTEWRALDAENMLYLDFAAGRVVIALAPGFAPRHVANIKALVREGYFDGLAFIRSQDNYVVQLGDPDDKKPILKAQKTIKAEFAAPISAATGFTALGDSDVYAPEVGFVDSFPVARDPAVKLAWLTHCYGMVGVGRDENADSGNGSALYTVIGHAPRALDRNVTLVGRVVRGMELLSVLPRGKGDLGFYDKGEQPVPIRSIRVAADVPAKERTSIEVLRSDSPTFAKLIEARRSRSEAWYKYQVGHIELCNVPLPSR